MCDLLKKSALAYQALSEYEYTLICGKKGELTHIVLRFPIGAYHHLSGFQYARIATLREKKTALDTILSGKVSYVQLMDSGFQHSDRLENILHLKELLESNEFVFRYRKHENPHSRIQADYLIQQKNILLFISEEAPISTFKSDSNDYQRNCPRLTVLKIYRTHLKTGEQIIVYQRVNAKIRDKHN